MAMTTSMRAVASSVIVRALAIVLRGVAPPPSGGRLIQLKKKAAMNGFDGEGVTAARF